MWRSIYKYKVIFFSFNTGITTSRKRVRSLSLASLSRLQYLSVNLSSVGNAVITSMLGRWVENAIAPIICASVYPCFYILCKVIIFNFTKQNIGYG
uniref:Uncharacterized protein n=1 Tax=Klebsiella pneumoniae TaxID=573 RepID=A0A8B0SXM8_KLEPN|nr:hypothetical protein [Klebsiella pneumoniae]